MSQGRRFRTGAIAAAFALLISSASAIYAEAPPPPAEIGAIPIALMVDLGSGQTLAATNPDKPFLPASMTKVMTAFVAFEEIAKGRLDPGRVFAVRAKTAQDWKGRGTSMYLDAGERVSAHDLLRGIMTASANDASVVLAEGHAGSVEAWLDLMNATGRRLGMAGSHFNTPNGWPDEGKTHVTARDLVRLADAMIERHPALYRTYSGKKGMEWKQVALFSHDPATGVVEGADGIKTGYTREAGYNFLGSAKRGERRLVMVLAGARSASQRAAASRAFFEWGFEQWQARALFAAGEKIAFAKVQGGAKPRIALKSARPLYATVPRSGSDPITLTLHYRGPLEAPIEKGRQVAELEVRVGDGAASRFPLLAAETIAEASFMDRLLNGLKNLFA